MSISPLSRHDSHLIIAKTLYSNNLVIVGEEFRFGRGIRHPEEHSPRDCDCNNTEEEKDDLAHVRERELEIEWSFLPGMALEANEY